jgi:HEAT repeat protein
MTTKVHFSPAVPPPNTSSETAPNKTGASACAAVRDALQHDQAPHVRWKAAQALGAIGDPRAVDPLIDALRDADADVLEEIPGALASLGDRRAIEPIAALLGDQRSQVSGNAAEALLSLDPQQAARFMTERGIISPPTS